MTFHGKPRADEKVMAHVHESPAVMIVPLFVLATGAAVAGYAGYEAFVGEHAGAFWGDAILILPSHTALADAHHVPGWVKWLPVVVAVAGIGMAYVLYVLAPSWPARIAERFGAVYRFLLNKWYFDELYNAVFVRPAFVLGRGFWKTGDGMLIDGLGPDGVAATTVDIARRSTRLQTGFLYHYAFAMLIGIVVFVTWYLFAAAG